MNDKPIGEANADVCQPRHYISFFSTNLYNLSIRLHS